MEHFEKTTASRQIFEGRVFTVKIDDAVLENGKPVQREVVVHPGGVGVVALDGAGNVLLVRQFRYPFQSELLELPAGKLEWGEDTRACGLRELEEETGHRADECRYLGEVYPTPAYVSERIHLYYATGLHKTRQNLDADEFLSVVPLPLEEAVKKVLEGEIKDSKTQIGLLKVAALRQAGEL